MGTVGSAIGYCFKPTFLCLAHSALGVSVFMLGIITYTGWPKSSQKSLIIVYTTTFGILTVIGFLYQWCVLYIKEKREHDDDF